MTNQESDAADSATPYITDPETSSAWQDGSSGDVAGWEGPKDLGSTNQGSGLTEGGTDTEINTHGDITKGGLPGEYGTQGDTVGGDQSGELWSGTGIPPKPEGDFEV
jgi:hypothetical protein